MKVDENSIPAMACTVVKLGDEDKSKVGLSVVGSEVGTMARIGVWIEEGAKVGT